jgi:cell division septum initiation protein DivIVA
MLDHATALIKAHMTDLDKLVDQVVAELETVQVEPAQVVDKIKPVRAATAAHTDLETAVAQAAQAEVHGQVVVVVAQAAAAQIHLLAA